ncbi:MAG: zinc-binding alcohol dehydrogenase family protein [Cyanobacteria bacterium P01_D01_bin.105]
MKAVGLYRYLPISEQDSLQDVEIAKPKAQGHDLLVAVKAISVNPVDTKVRSPKSTVETEPKILGWDAAGVVVSVGEKVSAYQPGDEVYYAGDITRCGSYCEYQLVDERIVGRKPKMLSFAEAAALPLTTITAWEALFDRLAVSASGADIGKSVLIVNGAGGVGSVAIQLAKQVAKLTVIASASRPETVSWCEQLGADEIVNHRHNLAVELKSIGYQTVDYILCFNDTDGHWAAMAEAIKPQGMICSIVENREPLNMGALKSKSAGFVWEFMFTRSMYETTDMAEQRALLNRVSELVDEGRVKTTCREVVTPINAQTLRLVHEKIEAGRTIGKIVLTDWS